MLHDPQYKAKAKQVGAALSPWKEMVGPVDRSFQSIGVIPFQSKTNFTCTILNHVARAVWWLEQITNNPGVYTMEDFYQKYPSPLA